MLLTGKNFNSGHGRLLVRGAEKLALDLQSGTRRSPLFHSKGVSWCYQPHPAYLSRIANNLFSYFSSWWFVSVEKTLFLLFFIGFYCGQIKKPKNGNQEKMIHRKELLDLFPLLDSTIYKMDQNGQFPPSFCPDFRTRCLGFGKIIGIVADETSSAN